MQPEPSFISSLIFVFSRTSSTSSSSTTVASRVRSASVGRDKRSDLQARYWAFLFENVRRAVDDLYTTCESDESIPATKEVIFLFLLVPIVLYLTVFDEMESTSNYAFSFNIFFLFRLFQCLKITYEIFEIWQIG